MFLSPLDITQTEDKYNKTCELSLVNLHMCPWKQDGNITAENFRWMESTEDYVQSQALELEVFNFKALMTSFKYNKFMI